jgi:hypothetical protein
MPAFSRSACAIAIVCLATGTALAQEKSGYLGDAYVRLEDTGSPSGQQVKRWVSAEMSAGKYTRMVLEKTVLYPEPKPSKQVSAEVLKEITAYLDEALRRELSGVVQLVDQPGPGTLRVKPAITAAAAKDQGLQVYEVLPIAFVFAQATKAAGARAKEATLAMEWEARDAQTNALIGAGMREGTGQKLKETNDPITLAHYKSVLDGWAKDARAFFESAKTR